MSTGLFGSAVSLQDLGTYIQANGEQPSMLGIPVSRIASAAQPFGASGLPGAPDVSLNSGITFQPPSTSTFRFGDPNNFGPPADVTYAANPINTAGLFGSVVTAGPAPAAPASPATTTKPTTTTDSTTDALNRLIDLASQQGAGGGGGGIVALPTGIADGGAASGGGISPLAIVIVAAIVIGGLWYFNHKKKAKGAEHHA